MNSNNDKGVMTVLGVAAVVVIAKYWLFKKPARNWDVNGDGHVNVNDISWLTRMMTGELPYDARFDWNGDGQIDQTEINMLRDHILGLI
jgi:hypothetical protein